MAEPVLRLDEPAQEFRRPHRHRRRRPSRSRRGELHAVIGPNGAGKTTLINQISGLLAPDAGRIVFAGATSPRCRCMRAPRSGSRARSRSPRSCRASPRWRTSRSPCRRAPARASASCGRADAERALNEPAVAALAEVGLGRARRRSRPGICRTARSARSSSRSRSPWSRSCCCSTSRWRAPAARRPSGWSRCCARLKGRFPMVLVEHDMTAVFALADRISVLIYGRILASGTPDAGAGRSGRSSPPISATRWSEAMLAVEQLAAAYGPAQVLFDVTLRGRRRRGRDPARPQRHGQDHHHPHHHGPGAGDRRRGDVRRPHAHRAPALRDRAGRARSRARRPADLPDPDGGGEPGRDRRGALRRRRNGRSAGLRASSRSSPSGGATWATSCPAASSRCWRSAAP